MKVELKNVIVIKVKQTLKAGDVSWAAGTVLDRRIKSFPQDIVNEISAFLQGRSRAIEILMTQSDVAEEEKKLSDAEAARAVAVENEKAAVKIVTDQEARIKELEATLAGAEKTIADYEVQLQETVVDIAKGKAKK